MFRGFSNAIDALLAVQRAVEAVGESDYFGYGTTSGGGYPPVNLFQSGEDTIVIVEIPGVEKKDIGLELRNGIVRITGERRIEYPKEASVHRLERRNVKFDRSIRLLVKVDADKIKADYKNGVLKGVLPRAESDKPKQIAIGE